MSAKAAPRVRTAVRPQAAGAGARRRPPARAKKPGALAQVSRLLARGLAAMPIPRDFLRRVRNWGLVLLLIAGIGAGVVAMGVPQMIGISLAHAAGRAGFVVRNVQIEGRDHVDRDAIYSAVTDARGQDMPLVDLEAMRRTLLGLAWVQDARVSRRLPDTLVIDIVERAPVAIWQYQQRLALIDATGETIAPLDPAKVPDQLPLVIGREANRHIGDLGRLIASQPVLKPLIQDASWVGDRRWDLRFNSGETLSLPEGEAAATAALARFAHQDSESRLLGKGIDRFDMRDPARMIVRVTREPGLRLDRIDPAATPDAGAPAAAGIEGGAAAAAPKPAGAPAAQTVSEQIL